MLHELKTQLKVFEFFAAECLVFIVSYNPE